jgi:hypothetical protein
MLGSVGTGEARKKDSARAKFTGMDDGRRMVSRRIASFVVWFAYGFLQRNTAKLCLGACLISDVP